MLVNALQALSKNSIPSGIAVSFKRQNDIYYRQTDGEYIHTLFAIAEERVRSTTTM